MSLADKISAYNRERKYRAFLEIVGTDANTRVLDVGFNAREYSPVDNYLEKNYQWPENITALGIDDPDGFRKRYPKVKAVRYDGKIFPFGDKAYDVCWSNAVIEHVGDREAQVLFLKEIGRVADTAFVTTPNRHFPIEVHTRTILLHMLPKRIFHTYLRVVGKKWAAGNYMNLLSKSDLKSLLKLAGITEYAIIPSRIAGFVMDYIVVIGKQKAQRS